VRSWGAKSEHNDEGDEHPVVSLLWNHCHKSCQRLSLELPTEAQWEYAARGPDSLRYAWGHDWDEDRLCWSGNQGPGGRTFPVGSFPSGASWCGALDMVGNVWEWCADRYYVDYYADSSPRDPAGPSSGRNRVLRGGSWGYGAASCRSANRYSGAPGEGGVYGGCRVARSCR